MRRWIWATAAAVLAPLSPATAADKVQFGPPEPWVVPVAAPPAPKETDDGSAFVILLDNEQGRLEKGKREYFGESVYRINSPQGLDDGNITLNWDPATETVIVHKLEIRRGNQVIDVLKSGQTFTTMRRETNLDEGMLDGELTATLLPEGLQVGDIVDLATTYVRADPVTKDNTEVELATFNGNPISRGYARLSWPSDLPVTFKTMGDLPQPKVTRKDGISAIEYDMKDIEPMVLPAHAPGRFRSVRGLEASTFSNWAQMAELMKPYYAAAAVIPPSGTLRDEVEKIRQLPGGDRAKVEAALKLVQDRIRYVALNMGSGGYIPASADTTWSRRFGDCKAKTALLLAILHELHVEAEPVLANTNGNDGLDQLQPELGWFDHVLVRAHLGGKAYWLDGTRIGDLSLDRLEVPAYDWGLPLVANAALVRMMPPPLANPTIEVAMSLDARDGIGLPAPATIDYVLRGDLGREANLKLNAKPPSQREQYIRDFFKSAADDWKTSIASLDPKAVSAKFDSTTGDLTYSFQGTAKLDWSDSNFFVQFSSLAYKPDFERKEGVNREAPIALDYPSYVKLVESIRLPAAFLKTPGKIDDVAATLVGTEYRRHAGFVGDTFTVETTERAMAPEVPYAEAIAASARLRELSSNAISIYVPDNYHWSDKEFAARMAEKPTTANEFIDRGNELLNRDRYDEAIADFTGAIGLDPKKALAFADRAIVYIYKNDKDHARADLESAAALDPDQAVMLRGKGLLAEQDGDWQAALDAYSKSLVKEPDSNFAIGHRAFAEAALSKLDDALADSARALKTDPSWVRLRIIRANIFLSRDNRDAAAREASLAISQNPGDDTAPITAGRIYAILDMTKEAMAAFDKALAAKPSVDAYLSRARARPRSDKASRFADLDSALKLEPDNGDVLLTKASYLAEDGNYAEAVNFYDRVLKRDHSIETEANRAVALYKAGRTAEAQAAFARAAADAKTPTDFNDLCWIKSTAGVMLDSALEECRQALKLRPGAGGYLDSLGMVLLKLGKVDEALDAYNQAIAKSTGADSLMGRAFVYLRKGDRPHADADEAAARKLYGHIDDIFSDYGLKWDAAAPTPTATKSASATK